MADSDDDSVRRSSLIKWHYWLPEDNSSISSNNKPSDHLSRMRHGEGIKKVVICNTVCLAGVCSVSDA